MYTDLRVKNPLFLSDFN